MGGVPEGKDANLYANRNLNKSSQVTPPKTSLAGCFQEM